MLTYVGIITGWTLAVIFGILAVSMLLLKNRLPALVLLLTLLLVLPSVNALLLNRFEFAIHPLLRAVLVGILLFVFGRLLLGAEVTSIYKSPEARARFLELYDEKMREWPVPYEDIFVDTEYGTVHVIASGHKAAPPLLLLHASGVGSWSWKFNAAGLSERCRIYAIDLIGDAGKSEFASMDHILRSGQDQAKLYAEICDRLGIGKAYVAGASEGGFIGTNFALHYPERVAKLALLGPMGYAGATQSVMRIMFAQFFPLKRIQERTFRWAFSADPRLEEAFGEWFRLVMTEYVSVKVAPLPFSPEDRQRLQVPVLFVFGERDNLVGDPEAARALVQDIPGVRVEIVEAGHLLAAERPEEVNTLLKAFFVSESLPLDTGGELADFHTQRAPHVV